MMTKNTGRGKTQVKVKELPEAEKKLDAKDMKKVRGGSDFNNDGKIDSADDVIARKVNLIPKLH